MIDYLKRLRSPALMAVLAVIGVLVLMSIGHFIVLLMRGTGIPGAARQAGATSPSLLWVFAAVALAVTCVLIRPVVTNAQKLVGAAAILVASAAALMNGGWPRQLRLTTGREHRRTRASVTSSSIPRARNGCFCATP